WLHFAVDGLLNILNSVTLIYFLEAFIYHTLVLVVNA
ncbi:MAG: hypothetical protein RL017_842, partial [Pseudomonadota bacterium]